ANSVQTENPAVEEAISAGLEDDKRKERTAAAYLETLKERQAVLNETAKRLRVADTALNTAALALIAAATVTAFVNVALAFLRILFTLGAAVAVASIKLLRFAEKATSLTIVA